MGGTDAHHIGSRPCSRDTSTANTANTAIALFTLSQPTLSRCAPGPTVPASLSVYRRPLALFYVQPKSDHMPVLSETPLRWLLWAG